MKSDINEHLPVLRGLASECRHVTEFGLRTGVSTIALICAEPEILISYDIDPGMEESYQRLNPFAKQLGVHFTFICEDTGKIICDPTDMLFIDTWHNFVHIEKELALSGMQARKYLVFHDTVTFGQRGEKGGVGIMPAIQNFLRKHSNVWHVKKHYTHNNGLLVLERGDVI